MQDNKIVKEFHEAQRQNIKYLLIFYHKLFITFTKLNVYIRRKASVYTEYAQKKTNATRQIAPMDWHSKIELSIIMFMLILLHYWQNKL